MLCPLSPVYEEDLVQLNGAMSNSLIVDTEEDLISFSPTPSSPHISSIKQEPDKPAFVKELLGHVHDAHAQALSQANTKDDPFLDDSDEDVDPNEHERLLNTLVGLHQQVHTASSALATKLQQQTSNSTSSYTSSYTNSSTDNCCRNLFKDWPSTHSSASEGFPTAYHHDTLLASPALVREAPFPFISSPGCVVTIHNLPYNISMRDILARVRGGEIRIATLARLRDTTCAVIAFKEARSAQYFVHASKSFEDEIWTFKTAEEDADPKKAQIAYTPTLETSKLFNDPVDIPVEPRHSLELDLATRCLAITDCSFELIEDIWKSFSFLRTLKCPHIIDQLEDIWLDDFRRGDGGRIEFATMHIWYTSTRMACNILNTVKGRHWSKNMRYEADPCDKAPSVLFFRPSDDAGFAWHSNPNHSLLDVYKAGCIDELFNTWREISQAVKGTGVGLPLAGDFPRLLPSQNMATRERAALTNGGFDVITLMSRSSLDYDSDDEGGRGPPRIDTRKIEAQRAAMRRAQIQGPLLSPTAYLTALEELANKTPSTALYSPGTSHEHEKRVHAGSPSQPNEQTSKGKAVEHSHSVSSDDSDPLDTPTSGADSMKTSAWREPKKNPAYSEENLESLRKAFKEPTHWWSVSIEEFLACDDLQRKTMGTAFYVPPEGHNSLKKYAWTEDSVPHPGREC